MQDIRKYEFPPSWFTERRIEIHRTPDQRGIPRESRELTVPEDAPEAPCPLCLEPLPLVELDPSQEYRRCPICRRAVVEAALATPSAIQDRAMQVEVLYEEIRFLRFIDDKLMSSFYDLTGGGNTKSYDEGLDEEARLRVTYQFLEGLKPRILAGLGSPVEILSAGLFEYSGEKGRLPFEISKMRDYLPRALKLHKGPTNPLAVLDHQLGIVCGTNWAGYGYPHCEQTAVIGLLKGRGKLLRDALSQPKNG